jgi:glycosyltransferase involved in cell wall biosynthesis
MHRSKIAIIHPDLRLWGGGSEACALWALEALKDDYDVYLITSIVGDLAHLNTFYHTKLYPAEISILQVLPPVFLKNLKRFAALKGYRLARFCKNISSNFDLMFSAYNPMDFGVKGIQYVLDPNFNENLLKMLNPSQKKWERWFYKDSVFRRVYLKLSKYLKDFSLESMKKNLTIVDSDWTGRLTKEIYGIEALTIYPPVPDEFPDIPWDEKENGFISIGRIVPEKNLERIIDVLKEIDKQGFGIHFHIAGKGGNAKYMKYLKCLCSKNQRWILFENHISAQKKADFIAKHKFGIHGKENEPFGITTAEMVKAGCIVWVPNGGGQIEIVNHPMLIYESVEDAVNKINRVLKNESLQIELREHLAKQAKKFSAENFVSEIRKIVWQFLNEDLYLKE